MTAGLAVIEHGVVTGCGGAVCINYYTEFIDAA